MDFIGYMTIYIYMEFENDECASLEYSSDFQKIPKNMVKHLKEMAKKTALEFYGKEPTNIKFITREQYELMCKEDEDIETTTLRWQTNEDDNTEFEIDFDENHTVKSSNADKGGN